MRIALIPVETAGYLEGLEFGLNKLGVEARVITISGHPFKYSQKKPNPLWAQMTSRVAAKAESASAMASVVFSLQSLFWRTVGSFHVLWAFDAVVLNNGRSLLPLHLDVLIYRASGKRVIAMMGHGSEIRPVCVDSLGTELSPDQGWIKAIERANSERRRFVRRAEILSHAVISTPMLAHYLRKPYIDHLRIGMPVLINDLPCSPQQRRFGEKVTQKSGPLRVVHFPSQPRVKGSDLIVKILRKLQQEGLIVYEMVSGVPRVEVIARLRSADLLVDQLYSDIPMPVLASEAALLSVPAVVCGYGLAELRDHYPADWPPVVNCHPANLEHELRALCGQRESLQHLGMRAQEFAVHARSPEKIATKYMELLTQRLSGSPSLLSSYVERESSWGCGSSAEAIKDLHDRLTSNHVCAFFSSGDSRLEDGATP